MLISFSVENWMSFRDPVTFSMVASRERQHGDRVPRVAKYPLRILPVAAVYGGNASGKTNFFKALNFVKDFVLNGVGIDSPIPVIPFRLDDESLEKPSKFVFELLIEETIYEFSFAVTRKEVVEEKLVQITSSSEKILYHRKGDKPNFDDSLKNNERLEPVFVGTQDNLLFLTNSVSQKVGLFKPIYNWFKYNLVMLTPDTKFAPFEFYFDNRSPLHEKVNELLQKLDTGIAKLSGDKIPFDDLPLKEADKKKIQEQVKEGRPFRITTGSFEDRFYLTISGGELEVKKLVTSHQKPDGKFVKFDLSEESSGSLRAIDLLPAFVAISAPDSRNCYVIDELDRSLHTLLSRQLIEGFLWGCDQSSRSQLLFTTHDLLLMDQDLLRRDEMWVTERNDDGVTDIFSFSDFKDVRYDKDIRKSYLQGRLGGVPRIRQRGPLLDRRENGC